MAAKLTKYFQEVRSEMSKVTWPSKQETTMATIMVFIFVFLAAVFLFFADQVISVVVQWILGING